MMRGLLEKDFRLLKGQKNFFLIILVITVLLSMNSSDNFAVTYLTFIAGFMTISSFGYDDNGNCMPFLLTLPVSRRLYVKSKYLLGFLLTLTGWTCGMIISVVIALVNKTMPAPEELLFQVVWILIWMMIMAFTLPPLFKYGAEKGRMALLAIMLILMAVIFAASRLGEEMGLNMDASINALSGLGTAAILAGLTVIDLGMLLISYSISAKIVQKKEY